MRYKVATWNTQGYNGAKWEQIKLLLKTSDVVCVQEAGSLADDDGKCIDGFWVYGWPGKATEGNRNSRVSLAIVSRTATNINGFLPADTRGLAFIVINNVLYGSWHENRGQGGLGTALGRMRRDYPDVAPTIQSYIIGGDFNDPSHQAVAVGSSSRGRVVLTSSDYNLLYSRTKTHKAGTSGTGKVANLDRVYVSSDLTIVHHWAIDTKLVSDHNPVCAEIVGNTTEMTYWETFKSKLPWQGVA
jgi:hypothetical protein